MLVTFLSLSPCMLNLYLLFVFVLGGSRKLTAVDAKEIVSVFLWATI